MKTKSALLVILFMGLSFISGTAYAQPVVVTTIGNYTATPGQHLYMPVSVTNFTNIETVSLSLLYNPAVLSFTGDTLPNPALGVGTYLINSPIAGVVNIAWFSLIPVTLAGTAVLYKLKFTCNSGSCNLTWDTLMSGNCEYTDYDTDIIPALFINGTVAVSSPPPLFDINGNVTAGSSTFDAGKIEFYKWDSLNTCFQLQDSTGVDSSGAYSFNNILPGTYILKVIPDVTSAFYSTYLPTYFGDTPYWASADTLSTSQLNNPYNIHLVHIIGPMPGAGSIAGTVTNGLKFYSTGNPAANVEILLTNLSDQVLAVSYSNSSGQFSFDNLAWGSYKLRAEVTLILSTPMVLSLSPANPDIQNLNFHITANGIVTGLPGKTAEPQFLLNNLFPNPALDLIYIEITSDKATHISFEIYNLSGQMQIRQDRIIRRGYQKINMNTGGLRPGLYSLHLLTAEGTIYIRKFSITR
jgi:hypothetical protein